MKRPAKRSSRIADDEVAKALRRLKRLAKAEYGRSLSSLVEEAQPGSWDNDLATRRLGRLVGVEMKRPFAHPKAKPSPQTRAKRSWTLKEETQFARSLATKKGAPEARVLEILTTAYRVDHPTAVDVYAIARELHHEWGWFRQLVVWLHPQLCDDISLFSRLRNAVGDAGAGAMDVALATQVASIVGQVLTGVPLPVLIAVALFIIRTGTTEFCKLGDRWVREGSTLGSQEQ